MLHLPYQPIGIDADISQCQEAIFWGLRDSWNAEILRQWRLTHPGVPVTDIPEALLLTEADYESYGRVIIAPKGTNDSTVPAAAVYSKEGSDYVDVAINDQVVATSYFYVDKNVNQNGLVTGAFVITCNLTRLYGDKAQNADEWLRKEVGTFLNHSCTYGLNFGSMVSGARDGLAEFSGPIKDDLVQKDGYPWATLRVNFTMLANYY